jgi:hypothetical protein
MAFDEKNCFGFLLLEQIAAVSARISDLLDDADFRKICTFDDYVTYKTSWLQFAAEAGYDCETADFKDPFLRVIKTSPTNGFLTDATEKLGINLVGTFRSPQYCPRIDFVDYWFLSSHLHLLESKSYGYVNYSLLSMLCFQ